MSALPVAVDCHRDFVPRMPVELHAIVADGIDIRDIFSFLNVSRLWRAAWLREDMIRVLAARFLPPGFLLYHQEKASLEGSTLKGSELRELFCDRIRLLRLRAQGKFDTAFAMTGNAHGFTLDPECHPPPFTGHDVDSEADIQGTFVQWPSSRSDFGPRKYPWIGTKQKEGAFSYGEGTFAWLPANHSGPKHWRVVVDNLRTHVRKVYSIDPEPGIDGGPRILAVGERLLVVCTNRILQAWDLKTNAHQKQTIRKFPGGATVQGARVLIAGCRGFREAYTWTFGSDLRRIDLSSRRWEDQFDSPFNKADWACATPSTHLMFHPVRDNIFYVAISSTCMDEVWEYTDGVQTRTIQLDESTLPPGYRKASARYTRSRVYVQTSPYGRYVFGNTDTYSPILWHSPQKEACLSASDDFCVEALSFDALAGAFVVETYPSVLCGHVERDGVGGRTILRSTQKQDVSFWNGQMLTSVGCRLPPRPGQGRGSEFPLHASRERSLVGSRNGDDVPIYSPLQAQPKEASKPRVVFSRVTGSFQQMVEGYAPRPKPREWRLGVGPPVPLLLLRHILPNPALDFFLAHACDVSQELRDQDLSWNPDTLFQDDEFIVCASQQGYFVWKF